MRARSTIIGADCVIRHFCVIGEEVELGSNTIVDDHCLVERGAKIGRQVLITHRASICANATVGDRSVVSRALIWEGSRIGRDCQVFGDLVHHQAYPGVAEDESRPKSSPTLEDNVIVCSGATVVGGIVIGEGTYIGPGATVTRDVPPGVIVTGSG